MLNQIFGNFEEYSGRAGRTYLASGRKTKEEIQVVGQIGGTRRFGLPNGREFKGESVIEI
jgi:hypothetical protein